MKLNQITAKDNRPKKRYKVVDLFCGCGGMTLGLEKAGFKVLAGFDNWKPAIDVYGANFQQLLLKFPNSLLI